MSAHGGLVIGATALLGFLAWLLWEIEGAEPCACEVIAAVLPDAQPVPALARVPAKPPGISDAAMARRRAREPV